MVKKVNEVSKARQDHPETLAMVDPACLEEQEHQVNNLILNLIFSNYL